MKETFRALTHDIDAFCARLNGGLAAVAIVLGAIVLTASVFRAQQIIPAVMDGIAATNSVILDRSVQAADR